MSGGEPSSIKQKPSCAADLPILSPKCGKAAGCVYSNYLCAVLWGAERFSIETTLSIEGDMPSLRLGQIPAGQKFLSSVETFVPTCIKTHAHVAGFYEPSAAPMVRFYSRTRFAGERFEAGLRPSLFYERNCGGRVSLCIRLYTANGGRRPLRT